MLHHAFVPTHPEPTSQRYTTKPQTVRFSSHTSVLNFAGTDYTSHVCQPWTNVAKIHHKTSDPKIFMSHPSFELCRSSFPYSTTHVCQPILNQPPKTHYLQTSIRKFSSHTSLFWTLPEQLETDDTTHVCQPWTNVPKIHHKTSDPKIVISHICFKLCRSSSPYSTTHVCQPILNQPPKTHYLQTSIRKFSSRTARNRWHHACEPTLNQLSKDTPQNLKP